MLSTYTLIRDHLEQANAVVQGSDPESRRLREVLQMVIGLLDELQMVAQHRQAKVIRFPERRHQRLRDHH